MNDRVLSYVLEMNESRFPLRDVEGAEALSRPFRFDVRFRADKGFDFDPDRFARAGVSLLIVRGDEIVRRITGVVTEAWCEAVSRGEPDIELVVEPRLALARHRADMRVFRDMAVPDIVEAVLRPFGVAIERRLVGNCAIRPYTVELRETDLDFASRLLEDEGIFYFFADDGTMVLGDSPSAWESLDPAPLPFRPGAGLETDTEAIVELSQRARVMAGKVSLCDFNPERPSLDMRVEAQGPTPIGPELYDHPGEYALPDAGAQKARRIAEELTAHHAGLSGTTITGRLMPGHRFELEGAPAPITDGPLTVTSIAHAWKRTTQGFGLAFDAIDARIPFRPARVTPAPRLLNPLTGVVTGPKDSDVHTDPLGRVKVRLAWDRGSPLDDSCSDWIPVIQDNTGHSCGIPRVGWEVLVHFLEGDPDRPVVLGRLYNAIDPPPESLPEGKTASRMESRTSPGRAGANRIRIDDAAGSELMSLQAERDQDIAIANDKRIDVSREETRHVEGNQRITIAQNETVVVGGDASTDVVGSQAWTVTGGRRVSVAGSDEVAVKGDHALAVGGMHMRRIKTDDGVQARDLREKVGAVILEASLRENSITSAKSTSVMVGGAVVELARKDKAESTRLARAEAVGGLVISTSGGPTTVKAIKSRTTTVGGAMTVESVGALAIGGRTVEVAVGGTGYFAADSLSLEVGESKVVFADGVLYVKSASVTVEATGAAALHQAGAKLW